MSEKPIARLYPRSVLFVPGDKPRAIDKAITLGADALILDLEDAVAPERKDAARDGLASAMDGWSEVDVIRAIRINGVETDAFKDDVTLAAAAGPDVIVLPKADSADILKTARDALDTAGFTGPLWAMIETPLSIIHLREIGEAAADLNVTALIAGTNDLALALGINAGVERSALLPHLSQIVLHAKAYELIALDGVYNDFSDPQGLTQQSGQGKALGFHGKTAIHPSQVEIIKTAFSPSEADQDWARSIIEAFEDPANTGKGAINVNGQMAERLHYEQALAILAQV